jgi:ribosome-binding factor A
MADSRRVERVAALIRREMSELLINGIRDERVQLGMISITAVQVAGDLQHCRIYVSVLGSDAERDQALEGLRSASSYVKGELSRRMKLRRTPEVVFHLDKGLEKGTAVLGVLHRLENERQNRLQAEADAAGTELELELDSHLLEPPQNPNGGSQAPEADGP